MASGTTHTSKHLGTTVPNRDRERRFKTTNKQFARNDATFRRACELARVEPTKRQASKFRNQQGLAYTFLMRYDITV